MQDAVRSGDLEAARAALDSGADANIRDSLGATPLHAAVWAGRADLVVAEFGNSDSGASLGDILGAALRERANRD